ncbi:Rieske (2Fe-2S) protein [Marinospirillum sp. MEB164]|uniref:Rieske (2Fe-2S) protein n=1 Tax=Marinospirillum alkalitolerans TaxID=3123374 RepID=A0ABW8PV27_9GAMM
MNWESLATTTELAEGQLLICTTSAGDEVLLTRLQGAVHAVENACSHDGRSFEGGCIEGDGLLVCPRHGARFCLRTGKALTPPAYTDLETYSVKEEEGRIFIQPLD